MNALLLWLFVLCSLFFVLGSWFLALVSLFFVLGSWFLALCSILNARRSWFFVLSSIYLISIQKKITTFAVAGNIEL
jgi:hypothetical protein